MKFNDAALKKLEVKKNTPGLKYHTPMGSNEMMQANTHIPTSAVQPCPVKQPVKVTDAEITQWDPLVNRMINELLRYWAKGNTIANLDPEATIGRLGMSISDLRQIGRMYVFHQLKWLKENFDPKRESGATFQTFMHTYLKNKFQSLSRIHANAKHGGGIIGIAEYRVTLEEFINLVDSSPEMTLEQAMEALSDVFESVNVELQRVIRVGMYTKGSHLRSKFKSAADISRHVSGRLARLEVVHHISLDDHQPGQVAYEAVEDITPETYLIAKRLIMENEMETPENEVNAVTTEKKKRTPRSGNYRIFVVAKEKGLPTSHGELAKLLGKEPSAFSNILHDRSQGDAAFKAKVQEIFGESMDTLRMPTVAPTV